MDDDPHADQQIVTAGSDLDSATAAVVLAHGRGATARGIVGMARDLPSDGVAYLAPQAARNTWYPNSFLAPVERNEPGRTSGLAALDRTVQRAVDAGIDRDAVLVGGFSQGACLASEYVARNPQRYGGLVAFSGGLIGAAVDPDDYGGDLDGTPAFFGCSDADPHIPKERVHGSAAVIEQSGGDVETRLYEGMGHGINADETEYASGMVSDLL